MENNHKEKSIWFGAFIVIFFLCWAYLWYDARPSTPSPTATSTLEEFCFYYFPLDKTICVKNTGEIQGKIDALWKEKERDEKIHCSKYANYLAGQIPLKDSKVCSEYYNK